MASSEERQRMKEITKLFKKKKMVHSTKIKGGWFTTLDDAELLIQKFEARWGVKPSFYCFMQLVGTYVLLGPVPR